MMRSRSLAASSQIRIICLRDYLRRCQTSIAIHQAGNFWETHEVHTARSSGGDMLGHHFDIPGVCVGRTHLHQCQFQFLINERLSY